MVENEEEPDWGSESKLEFFLRLGTPFLYRDRSGSGAAFPASSHTFDPEKEVKSEEELELLSRVSPE